jgi:hypothetical protein
MPLRRSWLVWCLLCLGCQSLALPEGENADPEAERPLGYYDQDVARDSGVTSSPLSLAAEAIRQGDEAAACRHLACYLTDHPGHFEVRVHYADLLLHQDRREEARAEFVRCIAQAQERGQRTLRERIHCHGRLLDMAETEDDEYGMHLHRGLGLYLLAIERAELGDGEDGPLPVQAILCRAAGELTTARTLKPGASQPSWYLYKVWSALGQPAAAERWLRRTREIAAFDPLTPAEQRELQLALRAAPTTSSTTLARR